ncbi:hypothetical protein F9817_12150 [Vibrio sp. CAIM 722]|uniref:Uncharacterized protein n=1 Tax=Vibrio eleionomae TaxID=2653505 RepID=A0A7X4LL23_9VIBR|nr:hypothetical protein [Vibrio eleionomae]MZI93945.1 hypothetical protein [Vibrio eleionomae]
MTSNEFFDSNESMSIPSSLLSTADGSAFSIAYGANDTLWVVDPQADFANSNVVNHLLSQYQKGHKIGQINVVTGQSCADPQLRLEQSLAVVFDELPLIEVTQLPLNLFDNYQLNNLVITADTVYRIVGDTITNSELGRKAQQLHTLLSTLATEHAVERFIFDVEYL